MLLKRKGEGKQRSRHGQAGFTLLEFLVSLGFMGALGGLVMASSFIAIKSNAQTNAKATVAVEVTRASRWLVRDVHNAEMTDLADPGSDTSARFWDDEGTIDCIYSLNATSLERDCGGGEAVVGRGFSDLSFERDGELITVSYTVTAPNDPGVTEDVELNIALGGG